SNKLNLEIYNRNTGSEESGISLKNIPIPKILNVS
ncbi:unnamed protein product, partial [marine sediment metagenome]